MTEKSLDFHICDWQIYILLYTCYDPCVNVHFRSWCHCYSAKTLQTTSGWFTLQWIFSTRRGYETLSTCNLTDLYYELAGWKLLSQLWILGKVWECFVVVVVVSVADGSYVSVPSPLGKIKSMTKGKKHTHTHIHRVSWLHESLLLWDSFNVLKYCYPQSPKSSESQWVRNCLQTSSYCVIARV